MCGIAGLLGKVGKAEAREAAEAMGAALVHRGPDDAGVEAFDVGTSGALALAHRRLAIFDLSAAGHQPMSLDGRLCVAYNGEIYNYVELRDELKALGRRFVTATDTEVLLHAYDEWGESCLERFNGMWSFALWDAARETLFCSVDRSGIKPFYYASDGQRFAFASEPKALLELGWLPRKVNRERALVFLIGLIDQVDDQTMFEGIRRLLPGHSLSLRVGQAPRCQPWWTPRPGPGPMSAGEARELLRTTLRDSIRLRFRSDVPVGINLSGGVDSTGLVSTAADMIERGELHLKERLRTFTATTRDPELNEGPVAARIASLCQAESIQVEPRYEDLLKGDLEKLVWHQDEPFGSLSVYMQFCVARRVRETGTVVVLSGQGPDELFLGYAWQYPYVWGDLLAKHRYLQALSQIAGAITHGTVGWMDLLGYVAYARAPSVRVRRYSRRVAGLLEPSVDLAPTLQRLSQLFGRVNGPQLLARETQGLGLPGLLRYEDRNSMAFSVESRLPYLDPRILELAYALPSWEKIRGGWSKAILRSALEDVAPKDVLWRRRKIGYAAPQGDFMAMLAPFVREVFTGARGPVRSEHLLDGQAIVAALDRTPGGAGHLWRFLSLEMWLRAFDLTC